MKRIFFALLLALLPTTAHAQPTGAGLFTRIFINSQQIRSGTGSPEGVVTGNIGDVWLRSDSPGGLYIKTSGTGNTGWTLSSGGASGYWTFDNAGPPPNKIRAFAEYTGTDPGTDLYGLSTEMKIGVTTDFSDFFIGHNFHTNTNTTAGVDIANITGTYIDAYNQSTGVTGYQVSLTTEARRFGTGSTTDMFGIDMFSSAEATSTVTNLYGIKIYQPQEIGSGAIQNNFAIDIDNQAITGSTANWAIRYNAGVFGVKSDGKVNLNSVEYTFPANNGDASQCLQTDGSGVLTWAACGTGGSSSGSGPLIVRKTSDETVTSSTTLQDDNELTFAIAANDVWVVQANIYYDAVTGADLKTAFSLPSGATALDGSHRAEVGATGTIASGNWNTQSDFTTPGESIAGGAGAGSILFKSDIITIVNGANAGNVTLRWAQNTSNATGTIVKALSNFVAIKAGAGGAGTTSLGITIYEGGSVISTGTKGFVVADRNCTITEVTLLSTDASATAGSAVLDVWKDTYGNYPPTNADSITASAKPTLSSANKATDTTLTGWSKSVTVGDVIGFEVESASTVTKLDLFMRCQ